MWSAGNIRSFIDTDALFFLVCWDSRANASIVQHAFPHRAREFTSRMCNGTNVVGVPYPMALLISRSYTNWKTSFPDTEMPRPLRSLQKLERVTN